MLAVGLGSEPEPTTLTTPYCSYRETEAPKGRNCIGRCVGTVETRTPVSCCGWGGLPLRVQSPLNSGQTEARAASSLSQKHGLQGKRSPPRTPTCSSETGFPAELGVSGGLFPSLGEL